MANPFVHIELNTDDTTKAKKFYKSIFGWKMEDMPMGPGMTYTMIDAGEGTSGGISQKPAPEAPTMWLAYVQVDSVKKTIAKAAKGGAQIIVAEQAVPGMGTFGIFLDPSGAALGIWEPAAKPKAAKKAPAKKKAAKKPGAKKKVAKKPAAKKTVAKKPAAKKALVKKKATAKKSSK